MTGRGAFALEALLVEKILNGALHGRGDGNENPLRRQLRAVIVFVMADVDSRDGHCLGHVFGLGAHLVAALAPDLCLSAEGARRLRNCGAQCQSLRL